MNTTKKSTIPCGLIVSLLAIAGCSDDAAESHDDTHGGSTSTGTTDGGTTAPSTTASSADGSTTAIDETDTGTHGDDGSTTASDDTGTDTDMDSTGEASGITLSGTVTNLANGEAVENVSVCVHEHPAIDCATTNAEGAYVLEGVPVGEGAMAFNGGGIFPGLFHGITPDMDDTLHYYAIQTLAAALLAASLGEEIDPARGHLGVWAIDANGDPLDQVSFEITPASGAGPGYITSESSIDPDLTETTEVGFGGWVNVNPGVIQITASHPTLDCTPHAAAIVGDEPDAIGMNVTAGRLSSTFPFVCT
jgi:hypothetical protein